MPTITVLPPGKSFNAESGVTLLKAIVDAGFPLSHNCGGVANCGTCHIYVQNGLKTVSRMTGAENSRLDAIVGVGSKSRLACQTTLGSEDVTVELLGFASGR